MRTIVTFEVDVTDADGSGDIAVWNAARRHINQVILQKANQASYQTALRKSKAT